MYVNICRRIIGLVASECYLMEKSFRMTFNVKCFRVTFNEKDNLFTQVKLRKNS